jgi:sugar lactone lactonase YvrE
MSVATPRYGGAGRRATTLADGWSADHVIAPSGLVGANGVLFGPDGDLYVAEAYGSEISAVDSRTGAVRVVSRTDDPIVSPDDVAFDAGGSMYVTELTAGRVSVRRPDGTVAVLDGDVPSANGIATHGDRLFVDEFRPGGRIFELYPDGRERRLIAEGVDWVNGMAVGPDDHLYWPAVLAGELWRVGMDGGTPERVVAGLSMPTAVKFSPAGELHTTLAGGDVLRVDARTGATTRIASVPRGIDNLAFRPDGRLYVSNQLDGSILELDAAGDARALVPSGLIGPFGLTIAPDGTLCVADAWSYGLVGPDGTIERPALVTTPGFPGVVRSVAYLADGRLVCGTTAGGVATFVPETDAQFLLTDVDGLMGIASTARGGVVAAASGSGEVLEVSADGAARTLGSGLAEPVGVAPLPDGSVVVSEAGAGRVVHLDGGRTRTLLDGLDEPHGVACDGDDVFVLDRGGRALHRVGLTDGTHDVIAEDLPVGAARGVRETILPGLPGMAPGPWRPFADVTIDAGGAVLVGCDGDGSVLALRPAPGRATAGTAR